LKIVEICNVLVGYAFYMYWRQFEMLWMNLASKLGFHPLTKAVLVAAISTTSPPKWPPEDSRNLQCASLSTRPGSYFTFSASCKKRQQVLVSNSG
jgi:hypothetical protein